MTTVAFVNPQPYIDDDEAWAFAHNGYREHRQLGPISFVTSSLHGRDRFLFWDLSLGTSSCWFSTAGACITLAIFQEPCLHRPMWP